MRRLIEAVEAIVAAKKAKRIEPAIATALEIQRAGIPYSEQWKLARQSGGRLSIGKTFNDFYYKVNG